MNHLVRAWYKTPGQVKSRGGWREGGEQGRMRNKRERRDDGLRSLLLATVMDSAAETAPARLTVLVESNESKYYLRSGS